MNLTMRNGGKRGKTPKSSLSMTPFYKHENQTKTTYSGKSSDSDSSGWCVRGGISDQGWGMRGTGCHWFDLEDIYKMCLLCPNLPSNTLVCAVLRGHYVIYLYLKIIYTYIGHVCVGKVVSTYREKFIYLQTKDWNTVSIYWYVTFFFFWIIPIFFFF